MQIEFIILIIIVISGFVGMFWFLNKKTGRDENQDEDLKNIRDEIKEIRGEVKGSLDKSIDFLQKQSGHSAKIIGDVTEKLTRLDETNKQVVNFADQLKNLQDILKNPKQRGVLGEYFLEETLKNVLPPNSYQMQYKFQDNEIVDAVVFVKDKIVPIDSKFSLENYEKILNCSDKEERTKLEKLFKQDLKTRIDETGKYVRPEENTMDFAMMFIPSEAIYYDLLVNKVGAVQISTRDLIEYAFQDKHVVIVSPTSFLAYLQTILQGLRSLQIEETAKDIRKNVEKLSKHILNYDEYMKRLGNQLGTTVNTYNTAYREFKKVDKDIMKVTDGKSEIEILEIEKPKVE